MAHGAPRERPLKDTVSTDLLRIMVNFILCLFISESLTMRTSNFLIASQQSSQPKPEPIPPLYTEAELKLHGGKKLDPLYEVKLPKGMQSPVLSESERIKAEEKTKAKEGNPELSDLDLLRQNLKKLLDSME